MSLIDHERIVHSEGNEDYDGGINNKSGQGAEVILFGSENDGVRGSTASLPVA